MGRSPMSETPPGFHLVDPNREDLAHCDICCKSEMEAIKGFTLRTMYRNGDSVVCEECVPEVSDE